MEKTQKNVFLALAILVLNMTPVPCSGYWRTSLYEPVQQKEITNLHFYMHDVLTGTDPTALLLARANTTTLGGPTPFGTAFVIDDPLTEGPERTSKVIGNGRGMYLSSSKGQDMSLVMFLDLGFTTGKFNGSSLSVFSRNPITENHREMAVVGGRGKFRFAEGYVKVKTQFLNTANGDAVLEYNVVAIHP